MSAESSWTILSVDKSEPRFRSHTVGKIRKTLKTDGSFYIFCEFLTKSVSKLLHPYQENERQDI